MHALIAVCDADSVIEYMFYYRREWGGVKAAGWGIFREVGELVGLSIAGCAPGDVGASAELSRRSTLPANSEARRTSECAPSPGSQERGGEAERCELAWMGAESLRR